MGSRTCQLLYRCGRPVAQEASADLAFGPRHPAQFYSVSDPRNARTSVCIRILLKLHRVTLQGSRLFNFQRKPRLN